jgi:hypothetical protein
MSIEYKFDIETGIIAPFYNFYLPLTNYSNIKPGLSPSQVVFPVAGANEYFTPEGKFLGIDDQNTDRSGNIYIVDELEWKYVPIKYRIVLGNNIPFKNFDMIQQLTSSKILSYTSEIEAEVYSKIFTHYFVKILTFNSDFIIEGVVSVKDRNEEVGDYNNIYDFDPSDYPNTTGYAIHFPDNERAELGIIICNRTFRYLFQKHNLMNMLVHEYKHVIDYRDGKYLDNNNDCIIAEKELTAITFQKKHSTWKKVTLGFTTFIDNYERENLQKQIINCD